jgi:hypothetical protein
MVDTTKFLTPEAMVTPGAAGGVIMLIATALSNNFALTQLNTSYLGLFLSFLFGVLILVANPRAWWERAIYYVINSLIIFCVAFGTGNLVAVKPAGSAHSSLAVFSSAYAQDISTTNLETLKKEFAQLDTQYNKEVTKLSQIQQTGAAQSDIEIQNTIIQKLQNQKSANLNQQSSLINKLGVGNPVSNNPTQIFKPWTSPLR